MSSLLTLKVLGDCQEGEIGEFSFYSGERRTLRVQLVDADTGQKMCVPQDVSAMELIVSGSPNDISFSTVDITIDPFDRSVVSVNLTPTITSYMITGKIQFSFTSATMGIRIAVVDFAIKRLLKITE